MNVQSCGRSELWSDFALVDSPDVGEGTRVWSFAHIVEGAKVGRDCNICESVFVEGGGVIGDRVTVKNGVQIWDGVVLEDDVFIGPNVSFANDRQPRSRMGKAPLPTTVAKGASIGAGATVLPGLTIGRDAMVGAGAVVTRDVPPFAVVVGNPARIVGYVDSVKGSRNPKSRGTGDVHDSRVDSDVTNLPGRCSIIQVVQASDMRGSLAAIEFATLPFEVRRFFAVYDVTSYEVRGEHAHKACTQGLVALAGSLSVVIDDGSDRLELTLDSPADVLVIRPGVWATQYKFTSGSVLGVLASHPYDPSDYIRDYEEFRAWKRRQINHAP